MGKDIDVLLTQGSDIQNFLKDVPKFQKSILS